MGSRLARLSLASAVMLLAVGLAAVGSGAKAPARVHPKALVAYAKVSGKSVRFRVDVTFPVPSGAAPTSACKGRVTLTEKVAPHRRAPHWAASLAAGGGLCEAKIKGKLPRGLFHKKVAFRLGFPGNGQVAPFNLAEKLKLSTPTANPGGTTGSGPGGTAGSGTPAPAPEPPSIPAEPYTAADGGWEGGGEGGNILFEVKEGVIQKNFSTYSSVLVTCEKKDSVPEVSHRYVLFQYRKDVPLGVAGAFADEYHDHFENSSFDGEIVWDVHGQLGSSTGTMVLEAHDGYFNEHFPEQPEYTVSECHLSITFGVHKN